MNKSIFINPKNCLKCGECCKSFSIEYNKNLKKDNPLMYSEIKRFKDLDTNLIEIIKRKNCIEVKFNFRCKHLIEKNGNFTCAIYNKNRPELCKHYPFSVSENCKFKLKE